MGGMGPGQMGWGHGNDVPHFDKEGHFRTHETYDRRRRQKMEGEFTPGVEHTGMLGQFVLISMIIAVGVLVPTLIVQSTARKPNKKEDP
jgi:hypothetical protein